ncbi:DsbA family protein [Streptomyces albipurpureus]|uniref:DsbA family protein n=1 Tax=Streptomyces albipurpureus TaxID=2897419 RepID=A0ABT0US84_9ACTN|nr:DsbA family protein [Streptomyces sp. CWNU-1]MCM2390935.1 DsbA family protein [Streptomyces sp. CWNU-1]
MPVRSSASPSRAPSSPPSPSPSSRRPLFIGAGVVVAALLLGIASYTATRPDDSPASSARTEVSADAQSGVYPELAKLARREAKDPLAVGRADAPVVMIEYADFLCGYCGKFARDTEPELIKEYVDKGVLRIEWRNFPIFGQESEDSARAAWAAGQQGRFWQFHSAAYAEGEKEKGFSKGRLKELAKRAGVPDLNRFAKDLDSEAAKASVSRDQEEAYGLGATSTPSFLVNGRPLAGAQPMESFTQAIEAAQRTAESSGKAGKGGKGDQGTEPTSE